MNLGESKTKTLKLIDEYSNKGIVTSESKNADYLLKMNDLANDAQMEIAAVAKIDATYDIVQDTIPSLLGWLQGFDIVTKLDNDYIVSATGGKSYYFEVNNPATVYIEEYLDNAWTVLATITNTIKYKYTAYKGFITPSNANNQLRIRFSGAYPYSIKNIAVYAYTFPSADDIPVYRPYIKYTMPVDFMELKQVVYEADPRIYGALGQLYWEGTKTLVVNYYNKGNIQVQYYKYPTVITTSTLDSYEFEISLESQDMIPYYMAGHILLHENNKINVALQLINEYQLKLSRITDKDIYGNTKMENAFNW